MEARYNFPTAIDRHPRFFPSLVREMADSLFALVFPSSCSLCHQELAEAGTIDVCRGCSSRLAPWTGAACDRCGLPLPSERVLDATVTLCGQCRIEEFDFDRARSFGVYSGTLRAAILQLKFRRRERWGKRLGELLAASWPSLVGAGAASPPLLIPVPLHHERQRERGYNQAELLARGLSRKLARAGRRPGPRVETRCLRRTRSTVSQTGLSLHQRRENVRGVFAVALPDRVRGRDVIIVDDVMTTGATLSACAGALKKAGAARVMGLTLARATPQFPYFEVAGASLAIDDLAGEST